MEVHSQPFGMALVGEPFYVGNTDGVVAFPYAAGADRITAPGKKLTTFKPGGHWTRSLLSSPDGKRLYAGGGSSSNRSGEHTSELPSPREILIRPFPSKKHKYVQ